MKIDGRKISDKILIKLSQQISQIPPHLPKPKLVIILVGRDRASLSFIHQKIKTGAKIGVEVELKKYPKSVTAKKLVSEITTLANNPLNHGLIIQRPLPANFQANQLNALIPPTKDIDGFLENSPHLPPVGLAILEILKIIHLHLNIKSSFISWLKSQQIALLGFGQTAGRPIYKTLAAYQIKPEIIRSQTSNRTQKLKAADIIISAVGKPNILQTQQLKSAAIVLGVGLSFINDKAVGDYNISQIEKKAKFYTPTPGGVGPVNVACLYQNLFTAYKMQLNLPTSP